MCSNFYSVESRPSGLAGAPSMMPPSQLRKAKGVDPGSKYPFAWRSPKTPPESARLRVARPRGSRRNLLRFGKLENRKRAF